jgi:nicotinate-nucleotide pyrophosphorylase (carboxylating)
VNVVEAALPLIRLALAEDLGARGDVTTSAVVRPETRARARLVAREAGVLAGVDVARRVFQEVEPAIVFEARLADGAPLAPGQVIAVIEGPARGILTAERVALNFLQRLSGVASQTARFVAALAGTGVSVLDTRKTTPGFRALEKYAVAVGGGRNHRQGLYDMVLIKDNHAEAAGGVGPAVERAGVMRRQGVLVEAEVQNLEQVEAALEAGVDGILLDNMTPAEVAGAVARIRREDPRPWIEVSGGVTLETIRSFAVPGVDFISVGALTHSVRSIDLALDFEPSADAGGPGTAGSVSAGGAAG